MTYDTDSNTAFFTFITTTLIDNKANRAVTICAPIFQQKNKKGITMRLWLTSPEKVRPFSFS